MIPRIGKGGASFRDAVHYYAHDKADPEQGGLAASSERVEWVIARNLPIDTTRGSHADQVEAMEKCAVVMQWTADHQADIKAAAGTSSAGRPLKKPVYTYSLAWAPQETPSKAEMLAAADETITLLGLDKHQLLIVAHNDTHMKHLHVIANRVEPNHGRAATMSCDRLKLSEWAEAYEKKRGQILVPQRVDNNKTRAANKATYNKLRSPGDPTKIVKDINLTREERARLKAYSGKSDDLIRSQRSSQQLAERENLIARHSRRQSLIDADLDKAYGKRLTAYRRDLRVINARIGATGWFRQAIRRLTGHHAHDVRQAHLIKKTIANLMARVAERRDLVQATIAHERVRLEGRHANERARDEAYIADRIRRREEAEEARAMAARSEPKRKRRATRRDDESGEGRAKRTRDRSEARKAHRDAASQEPSASDRPSAATRSTSQAKVAQWKARLAKKDRSRDRDRDR